MTSTNNNVLNLDDIRFQIRALLTDPSINFLDDANLIELGLDSLQIMQLVNQWRSAGASVTFAQLIETPTLSAWWQYLDESIGIDNLIETNHQSTENTHHKPFALTDIQHAYWIGRRNDQVLGGVGCHAYLELDGANIEPTKLAVAWNQLVKHHGMLRAIFGEDGQQMIRASVADVQLSVHDLRYHTADKVNVELKKIRDRLSHRRLYVEQGEVAGIELSLLPEGKTRIHFDIDLLIADVRSLQIILRDLALAYQNNATPAAPAAWDFSRYLELEKQYRAQERIEDEAYWQSRLQNLPQGPLLPLRVRPETISKPQFSRRSYFLPAPQWQNLRKHAAYYQVTPAMLLVSAYAEVIAAWSAHPRFLLNLPLFDRQLQMGYEGTQEAVADFTSLLLLTIDCSEILSFCERIRQIQAQFHADVAHASYSGVSIQRNLASLRQNPNTAAPVVFACNLGTPLLSDESQNCLGKLGFMISQTPQTWLDHQVYETDGGILLAWDAVDALFPEGMIDAMFTAYTQLLESLACEKNTWEQPIPSLLSESQRETRVQVNATQQLFETHLLHDGFFEHAKKFPDKIALISNDIEVSYAELAQRALQLAAMLIDQGIQSAEPIAITLPRGIEQIIAVLGVLAAGGCYVPVSLTHPPARQARIHNIAGIRYVLTSAQFQKTFTWEASVVPLDIQTLANFSALNEPLSLSPQQLSYVIFTSGSTGEPKGVEISHRSACNTIAAINQRYHVTTNDKILAVSSLDFDLSVYDIFGLFAAGGTVVLLDDNSWRNADVWLQLIQQHQINIWNSVPVLLQMLLTVAEGSQHKLPLRIAMLSGDWISLDLPKRLAAITRVSCQLVAMGGATEASIWSNFYEVDPEIPTDWLSIPYGKPLPNQMFRVVDSRGHDCPDWVVGELWIGGVGVAQGYRNDPALTSDRFISMDAQRWYRTGDIGRYWPDGTLEFMGRLDHQVKLRGHRIELSEIEAAILSHREVAQAVVIIMNEQSSLLVAAVVLKPNVFNIISNIEKGEDFKAYLKKQLPNYMVPARLAILETLPLSPNGKVDRQQIAEHLCQTLQTYTSHQYVAPRNSVETTMINLWNELLLHKVIGVEDNFFDLGGNSLLAVQLMMKIRQVFQVGLSLDAIFRAPTVENLAMLVSNQTQNSAWTPLVVMRSKGKNPPVFCIHPGGGSVFAYADLAQSLGSQQPFYALQAYGFEEGQEPHKTIEEMADCYLQAIRNQQPQGPYYLAGWSLGGLVAYEIAQQLQQKHAQTIGHIWMIEMATPTIVQTLNRRIPGIIVVGGFLGERMGKAFGYPQYEYINILAAKLLELPVEDQYPYVLELGKKAGLLTADYTLAQLQRWERLFHTTLQAAKIYQPKKYSGDITLFRSRENAVEHEDETLGWQDLVSGDVGVCWLNANHGTMILKPEVEKIAQMILQRTAKSQRKIHSEAGATAYV